MLPLDTSATLPLDSSCQAEYADGYVHDETALGDVAQYSEEGNVLTDILKKHPEKEHGRLVRFSCFWKDQRYDIDFTKLPDNARPIRFRHGYSTIDMDGTVIESGFSGVDFGVQFNDETGKNHKSIKELR